MEIMNYKELFNQMNPDFFEAEHIRNIPESEYYDEMVLCLKDYEAENYKKQFAKDISFGEYEGDIDELLEAVKEVEPEWVRYYENTDDTIYCALQDGKVASFCLIEDMGEHTVDGRTVKVGGTGCVGTVPAFRNRGLGLVMVDKATQILKDRGYDISYIHYTGVASWYEKLGYRTVLRWNCSGLVL